MNMDKAEILNGIHTLVSNNVIGSKQLMSRYKGFRGELLFSEFLTKKYAIYEQLNGGIIISKNSSETSLNNSIYFTVVSSKINLDDYLNIYVNLSKLNFEKSYLIVYHNDYNQLPVMHYAEETIKLPVPSFEILQYDAIEKQFITTDNRSKNITDFFTPLAKRRRNSKPITPDCKNWLLDHLMNFSKEQLIQVYFERLFLDGFIGFSKEKGKSSDIDMVLKHPNKEYRLIEIKEKDLPKKAKKGFGLDVPRLKDMERIQTESGMEYHLAIRHINNQTDRKLIDWKQISISNFSANVKNQKAIEGGTGMRSESSKNPTLICDLDQFRNI